MEQNRFPSPLGIPCRKPPFGTLPAIGLSTRQFVWQVLVGPVADTGIFGRKMRAPIPIGMPTLGGTIAAQGCPVFIAVVQDSCDPWASDRRTGAECGRSAFPSAARPARSAAARR